jgi:hypothetical protein
MSAITEAQKTETIRRLDYIKQKLMAYGVDPHWAMASPTNEQNDPSLTYGLENAAIAAELLEVYEVVSTWLLTEAPLQQ